MAKLEIKINGNTSGLNNALDGTSKRLDVFTAGFAGVAAGIATAFSVDKIVGFTKSVVDATAESQKLGAVLSNALGSSSLAADSMAKLQDFAAKTPFGINELAASFVKLVNQGFTPTIEQIRRLGDLASSTGKSFDQLAEAIIDAQVGEYERLKEFGIRASDQGDKVTFTFKGVQTQVEKTSSSIRDYITALGDAQGVSGSMAAISGTLSGQISNLQDSYDQMLISIGKNTSGAFSTAITWVDGLIQRVKSLNEEIETANNYGVASDAFQKINRAINPFADKGLTGREKSVIAIQAAAKATSEYVEEANKAARSSDDYNVAIKNLQNTADGIRQSNRPIQEIQGMVDQYYKGIQALLDLQKKFAENANKPVDANFGKSKGLDTNKVKNEYSSLLNIVDKLRNDSIISELTGFDKELEASRQRYEALKKMGEDFYGDGKISAKQYADYLSRLAGSEIEARGRIALKTGAITTGLAETQQSGPDTGVGKVVTKQIAGQIPDLTEDVSDEFTKGLTRASRRFADNFYQTLTGINQMADQSFGSIFSTITSGLLNSFNEVFINQVGNKLSEALKGGIDFGIKGISKTLANELTAGIGLAGGIISGATSKTSSVGQGIGGALGGAASGAALGSVIPGVGTAIGAAAGGLFGALGGLFSASSAKRQEALQEKQLIESEKQTALLERRNALSYASSITGQMTTQGIVTGISRNNTGQLVAKVSGSDLVFVMQRAQNANGRGML